MITIKNKIESLIRRLETSHLPNFNYDFKEFYDYITKNEYTSTLINNIYSNIDYEKLQDETEGQETNEMFQKYRTNQLKINSKFERIYYLLRVLEFINRYTSSPYSYVQGINIKIEGSNTIQGFIKVVINPIIDYFFESLQDDSQVLALILRYKKFREWFNRKLFFEQYDIDGRQEDFLDMDLREYLFQNGIDYPFSTPKSPSGRTDIIANIDTNDPLVLEVKVLDKSKGYTKSRISDGISQCLKYIDDYNKNVGYLAIFNADEKDKEILIDTDIKEYPTRVNYNGKNIYFIIININPKGKSASQIGKIEEIKISPTDFKL